MVSNKEKFYYGLGDLSGNIMFGAVSFFLLNFIIKVGGLNAALAGVVFIIARGWDAITDYWMGRIVDRTKSKYGKMRVYMLFGALPFGISFILLWWIPDTNVQLIKFIYFTLVYCLYNTFWTIVYIPYNSLTANMTNDYDERTSINTVRIIMANIGLLLGAAVFALLADGTTSIFYEKFGSLSKSYALSGILFGVIAALLMLVCAINTKERNSDLKQNQSGFFETLKQFFKIKEFRNTIMYYLLSMIGFDIIMAVFIFYVNDTLGFKGGDTSMLFVAIPLIVAIASAVIWEKLSKRFSKHKVYTFASIYTSIVLLFCLIIPYQSFIGLLAVCVGVGFGMSAIQILPYSSVPDVIEFDEYYNNVRREGAYYGIVSLMYKLASGLAIFVVSSILDLFGYIEGSQDTQPEEALLAIRLIFSILPGIIFIISIIFAYRANISRESLNFVKAEIEKRNK